MIESLKLINLPSNRSIPSFVEKNSFLLKTCQRTLILGLNHSLSNWAKAIEGPKILYLGEKAYQYLLEIICGLESKIIAENEIVNQFKSAYDLYLKRDNEQKNGVLMQCLEKLFKDAKEIRTNYLLGINQKTYGCLARRKLLDLKVPLERMVILGSGALAVDMINQMKKHGEIYLAARNEIKVGELVNDFGVFPLPWNQKEMILNFRYIINTIGANETLFDETFFENWQEQHSNQKLFIDLGSPSILKTSLRINEGVVRLEDIFEEGKVKDQEKLVKIEEARKAIEAITLKRSTGFTMNLPFCWEELQFN